LLQLIVHHTRDQEVARLRQLLKPGGQVDTSAIYVAWLNNHLTGMQSHAKGNLLLTGLSGLASVHLLLN
jgi:hypothetical protein